MDGQYSWKRTDDIEIDLMDLLYRFFGQWKQVLICALVFALVFGGYKCIKDQGSLGTALTDAEEDVVLTEAQEQAVMDAVFLESEIRGLETYLEKSVLMNLNPYQKARHIMMYRIDHARDQKLPLIADSYVNFILNGGAADALRESGNSSKLDKNYFAELVSAYQKTYSQPYRIVMDDEENSSQLAETFFYIEITGENARAAETMAFDIQEVLKKYSGNVQKDVGSHRLKLISSTESIITDNALQAQQHEKRNLLSANKTNLRAMLDAFSTGQMAVYLKAADMKEQDGSTESGADAAGGAETGINLKSVIKYMLLGLVAGIFIYASIFTCWYLFSDKVKSIAEMKRIYAFPVYGEAQAWNRMRLACHRQGLEKLCAAADYPLNTSEKEHLDSMVLQMKEWGIQMSVAENASTDMDVWDSMEETGNVLMIFRMGTVTHQMIDNAMNFYLENGITVAGAVVFPNK